MTSPKPLPLVTSFRWLDFFPWLLWSYSPWVTLSLSTCWWLPCLYSQPRPTSWATCPIPPSIGQLTSHRHVNQHFQNGTHHILRFPASLMSPVLGTLSLKIPLLGECALCPWRFLCLESVPLFLDHLTPSPGCYSSSRSQVRCRFFWEVFLDTSSLSQVRIWFWKLPFVIFY